MNLFKFWFLICDTRCWCGSPIQIITDPIGDLIGDVVDVIEDTVEDTVDILEEAVDLIENTAEGILDNAEMMIHGTITLDWTEFRDGTLNQIETAAYLIAIASGDPLLVASGVAALDGKYNNGQLTHKVVQMAAHLETGILGTEVISRNADYIEMGIILAGSIYAGMKCFSYLSELAGIKSYLATWSIAMGLNSSYEAYKQYEYWKGYYQEKMAEYQAWIDKQLAIAEQMKVQWFEIYGDVMNSEVLYEAMAGGYLFNAGAGSDEYSVSSIHEQGALILSIDTQRDMELDRQMYDISDNDYIKTGLKNIEPKAIGWA